MLVIITCVKARGSKTKELDDQTQWSKVQWIEIDETLNDTLMWQTTSFKVILDCRFGSFFNQTISTIKNKRYLIKKADLNRLLISSEARPNL